MALLKVREKCWLTRSRASTLAHGQETFPLFCWVYGKIVHVLRPEMVKRNFARTEKSGSIRGFKLANWLKKLSRLKHPERCVISK